ncbi:MAG: ribosome maturation factor RimM [Actinomycetaceae bacterium]|nr:ribosome maturation factor RimM [Actinomycetaceae bacterium]MDY5272588.1 ribosome maturation factor RimM [Arcanobacterium sp.]
MQLVVAIIGAAHGLKGEVKLDIRTDSPAQRLARGSVLETDPAAAGPLTVLNVREYKGAIFVRFAEISDRTTAQSMRGVKLVIESDEAEGEEEGAWYPHELRGLEALDPEGYELGIVEDLVVMPAQDLLVVRTAEGERIHVPFVQEIVPEVDIDDHCVVIDPPPGLFAQDEQDIVQDADDEI